MTGTSSRWSRVLLCSLAIVALALAGRGAGQAPAGPTASTFDGLKFRNIGPATMGGRVDDFAVLESNPAVFYVAAATSGLWKTTNNGTTWQALFDDQDEVVSIGDVAIAPNDANLVWVGSGENNNRQSSSWGNGVYKSTDGGRTWKPMGLADTRHVARVIVDPVDHDVVYVAALGHLWGPNKERGIFKTTDGGQTWTNTLFVNEDTGATELVMDPSNNKVLYAATYQRRRSAWGFNGGGPGSAIYKSADAGRTWTKLTTGIPEGPLGRIGLDVYRKNPNVVYARIEHERESGVYRSDDAGLSWKKMSGVNPRPMYFSQIRVDPSSDHRVYVLGVQLHISDDAGKTFREDGTLHSDHHAMWIDPSNPNHVMTGNDGGIGVSYDRAQTWDFIDNLVLGQFYHVGYDMEVPYHVYGGLQDNYAWGGPSAVRSRDGIANSDWFVIGGGDGFVGIADPKDARVLYTESQGGNMNRVDRTTNERKNIKPQVARGEPELRWNWDTPLMLSPHDSSVVLAGANKLFRSADRGQAWTAISPDLTEQIDREGLSLMGVAGKDIKIAKNDGVSAFGTLTTIAESPRRAGVYYTGADDGTVYVSRDGGKNWTAISQKFPGLRKGTYVSRLTPSAFEDGTVYATFDGHREDDYTTYAYASSDFGETWRSIAGNLPKTQGVKCITEDHKNPNVLYLGTEFGLFVSLDKGGRWTRLHGALPTSPIYEITLHPRDNDMLLATHGRGIWILDDLTPIQQAAQALQADAYLFDTRPAVQFNPANDRTNFAGHRRFWGKNPEFGAAISYALKSEAKEVRLSIRDAGGAVVREIAGDAVRDARKAGINRLHWDLRHDPLPAPRAGGGGGGGFGGGSPLNGPFVLPGDYQVTLAVNGRDVATKPVRVAGDRLIQMTDADRKTWHDTALALHQLQRTANEAADAVSLLGEQLKSVEDMVKAAGAPPDPVKAALDEAAKKMTELRQRLGVPAPGQTGGGFGGGGFGGGGQNVRGTITQLKSQIMASTSLPTAVQTRGAQQSREDLAKTVDEVNAMIATGLPNLYKALTTNNYLPVPLKPLRPISTTTSSGQPQRP